MSSREMVIGRCSICKQGMLEIVKEKSSGKLIICCDECEGEWEEPSDALQGTNGSRNKYGQTCDVTLNEVSRIGWTHYLL